MKDISFDDEYRELDSLKRLQKMRWKKKHTNMSYHNMYSSEGVWDKK